MIAALESWWYWTRDPASLSPGPGAGSPGDSNPQTSFLLILRPAALPSLSRLSACPRYALTLLAGKLNNCANKKSYKRKELFLQYPFRQVNGINGIIWDSQAENEPAHDKLPYVLLLSFNHIQSFKLSKNRVKLNENLLYNWLCVIKALKESDRDFNAVQGRHSGCRIYNIHKTNFLVICNLDIFKEIR